MTEIAITAFLRLCFTLTRKAVLGVLKECQITGEINIAGTQQS